jgi:DNA polymerase III sliding clamp (beta) subunit (PCNA family)
MANPINTAHIKLDREEFLHKLEEVQPGLTVGKEIVEQSGCFIFRNGYILTFNEEIACKTKSGLPKEAKGAVPHKKFTEILRALPDKSISVEIKKKEVVIRGKNKIAGLPLEREILIPIDIVDKPTEWKKLHEDFTDAVAIVQECATKDQTAFTLTCVHIHPKWIEAFDNSQMARYTLQTGVSSPFLVKKESIRFVPSYDFAYIAETGNWLHFKTNSGTVMSLRRYISEASDYSDLTKFIQLRGTPTVFPAQLGQVAERANIASSVNEDHNLVLVEIRSGKIRITGRSDALWYQEVKRLKYDGKQMQFRVAPKLLVEITKRGCEAEISKKRSLRVNGGKFVYAVMLEEV